MINILCFGDSNTYGLNPLVGLGEPLRHPYEVRWTGRLQALLGDGYRIIEEGNNGRTTVFEDPTAPDKCGAAYLPACLASHKPLDLVIITLGTNDCKPVFSACPHVIAMGVQRLAAMALNPAYHVGFAVPKVLIVSPVPMRENAVAMGDIFPPDIEKSAQLAPEYEKVAAQLGCGFLDLAPVARTSDLEGIHLMPEAHEAVAQAMFEKIREMGL